MNPLEIILKVDAAFGEKVIKPLASGVTPVDFVSHYTNFQAFLSMVKTNELWLSHHSFMNDATEIEFGISILRKLLQRSGRAAKICETLGAYVQRRDEFSLDLTLNLAFVFSLTELEDDAAPWNAYANGGNGISLQFINPKLIESLVEAIPGRKFIYFPVQYYSEDLIGAKTNIPDYFTVVLDYFAGIETEIKNEDVLHEPNLQTSIYLVTKLLASFIKHDFHKNEREWRLVVFTGRGDSKLDIIQSKDSIKMIYKLNPVKMIFADLLNCLILGPKHNKDERIRAAVQLYVNQHQHVPLLTRFSIGHIR